MKNRNITSKIPPRFAKKQGSMSIEQAEETLSANNLGTEIWETNSSGVVDKLNFAFTLSSFCLLYLAFIWVVKNRKKILQFLELLNLQHAIFFYCSIFYVYSLCPLIFVHFVCSTFSAIFRRRLLD